MTPFNFALLRAPLHSLSKSYNDVEDFDDLFLEGLYLASPEFWCEIQKIENKAYNDKIKQSLFKYWLRSCARCTPYGTFAGSLTVSISDNPTKIILDAPSGYNKYSRVDMDCIFSLVKSLEQMQSIRHQIKLFPNNSLYELSSSYRYAEYTLKNDKRVYRLTSIDKSDYVAWVLECAKPGATINQLAQVLIAHAGVGHDEASEFILEMWNSQVLTSDLEPSITGKEPLKQIIEKVSLLQGMEGLLTKLELLSAAINSPKHSAISYLEINKLLNEFIPVGLLPKNTVQTDIFLSSQTPNINSKLLGRILKQVEELMVFARSNKKPALEEFKKTFKAKFDDLEIPLALALDTDMGIGYPVTSLLLGESEWIAGLDNGNQSLSVTSDFDFIQKLSLLKYNEYLTERKTCIEITEDDLHEFKNKQPHSFPTSMFMIGSWLRKPDPCGPEEYFFDLSMLHGPSAGNLFGRFTYGDSRLQEFTRDVLRAEEAEDPDVIFAEIAHWPQSRLGNVLLRPLLREYEIPYVGKSGADIENQIEISDLTIRIINSQIVLRSKRMNKQVIPRLTTAHNYNVQSLPIYKFLCDLQQEGRSYINFWDWGHLSNLKMLPRVIYKDIVLKKASWQISEKDFPATVIPDCDLLDHFKKFREKLQMPARVMLKEGDNQLLIDFDHIKGIKLFLSYLKRNKTITTEEFLFSEDNCMVSNETGEPFINEVVIPLSLPTAQSKLTDHKAKEEHAAQTKFSPGSEWLYFKLYCGVVSAENILKQAVLPFIETGIAENLFEKFFFIRYRDDLPHLRIRFFNQDLQKQAILQAQFLTLLQPFFNDGQIGNIMIDSYSREINRYGPALIDATETLFYNDSLAVIRFIDLLDGEDSIKYRVLFALRGIDIFLDDFGYSILEKRELLKNMALSYFNEFGGRPSLQKSLNLKYKIHQKMIFSHMDASRDRENEIEDAVNIFRIRSEMNIAAIAEIFEKINSPADKLPSLLSSYSHMFINRLFIASQRKYELLVYNLLERYYTSQIAISKKSYVEN